MTVKVHDVVEQFIIELAERVGYVYDKRIHGFRNMRTGQTISKATVFQHIEKSNTAFFKRNMRNQTTRFLDGKITLAQWQGRMATELKEAYRLNMVVGKGGVKNVLPSDWGRIGGRLRSEYGYLNNFAQEIKMGRLSEAQIRQRVDMYANGSSTAFYDGMTASMQEYGMQFERRVMTPAEHCADCDGYEQLGWQAIGTLPPPGTGSVCGHNCHCIMEYKGAEGQSEDMAMVGGDIGVHPTYVDPLMPRPKGGFQFASEAEAEVWAREAFPHIQFDFTHLDPRCLDEILDELVMLSKKYPEVTGRLRYVGSLGRATADSPAIIEGARTRWVTQEFWKDNLNIYMSASRDGTGIFINPRYFTNYDEAVALLRHDVTVGHSAESLIHAKPRAIFRHEYGHHINNWLNAQYGFTFYPGAQIRVATSKGYFIQLNQYPGTLSTYGLETTREGFAEGFSALRYRKNWNTFEYTVNQRKYIDYINSAKRYSIDALPDYMTQWELMVDDTWATIKAKRITNIDDAISLFDDLYSKAHLKLAAEREIAVQEAQVISDYLTSINAGQQKSMSRMLPKIKKPTRWDIENFISKEL